MKKTIVVEVTGKRRLYPQKDLCCSFAGHSLEFYPARKSGFIGGFFDELFKLQVGSVYQVTVVKVFGKKR